MDLRATRLISDDPWVQFIDHMMSLRNKPEVSKILDRQIIESFNRQSGNLRREIGRCSQK